MNSSRVLAWLNAPLCLSLVESAAEVTRGSDGGLFLHSSHLHAHVLCLDHDHHTERMEGVLYAVLYLLRQTLLHLKSMTVDINHPCYLREACDVSVRYVCHMHLAVERQHVMLASSSPSRYSVSGFMSYCDTVIGPLTSVAEPNPAFFTCFNIFTASS